VLVLALLLYCYYCCCCWSCRCFSLCLLGWGWGAVLFCTCAPIRWGPTPRQPEFQSGRGPGPGRLELMISVVQLRPACPGCSGQDQSFQIRPDPTTSTHQPPARLPVHFFGFRPPLSASLVELGTHPIRVRSGPARPSFRPPSVVVTWPPSVQPDQDWLRSVAVAA
jgi:hypothetical protein